MVCTLRESRPKEVPCHDQRVEQGRQWRNSLLSSESHLVSPILLSSFAPSKTNGEQANKREFDSASFECLSDRKARCFRVSIVTLDLDNFGREISPSSSLDQQFS